MQVFEIFAELEGSIHILQLVHVLFQSTDENLLFRVYFGMLLKLLNFFNIAYVQNTVNLQLVTDLNCNSCLQEE